MTRFTTATTMNNTSAIKPRDMRKQGKRSEETHPGCIHRASPDTRKEDINLKTPSRLS
ncbi:hypothetical protein F2Q70_00003408 [Brassica cretica]|uniref:Uncharacterized protein n=1 Tax=Brassica cretica TaxID=69181 RepID=A0A8S9J099_BRACR|nr:hypothetical protein F2Q70_00003408 [Brassica cretica]KAF3565416.1 hypothetical protein DY000_02015290 [Brassica cretica]